MDEKLFEVILWHSRTYPHMKPADYVKLLYQDEFGCAHMMASPEQSLEQLREEFASLPISDSASDSMPRMELIGNGLCRIFLAPGRQTEKLLPLIHLMSLATASTHLGNRARLQRKLELLSRMAQKGQLCVGREEMDSYLKEYAASAGGPVSHSTDYKSRYVPHYRVIRTAYYDYLPVLQAVMEQRQTYSGPEPELFAVDGRCGSGKSFLAGLISEVFGCRVFHMDDFFLPPQSRDKDWLLQPAGNIDRTRFLNEVLMPLRNGDPVRYRPYSCREGRMLPEEEVHPGRFAVVEGSYCLHPDFRSCYDYRVFLTCLPNVQQRRIFLRGDKNRLHDFLEYWIPAEERYFEALKVPEICQLTLDTSNFEN
ncbi:MAG: hypothetical protein LKJ17_07815 [Oscillospiraceae bacterium]|jgi:uridine kinase|nr:hypothetical protein [Oscillospiraceae bacterium]